MVLKGKAIAELSADLAAGYITERMIKEQLGDGVLNSVLAIEGGFLGAALATYALDAINEETGIMDDIGSVVDDIFSIF